MKCVVVAVDGSEQGKSALNLAIEIAEKFGAEIITLNVHTLPYVPPDPYVVTDGSLEENLRKYGEELARGAAEYAKSKGVTASWQSAVGSPADVIFDVALAKQADLVVVGSRGRGAVARTVLGSVSSRLAHICTIPLLIVH